MKHIPTQADVAVAVAELRDIFERSDMECYYKKAQCARQGQWRNVKVLAKRAILALGGDLPQTIEQQVAAERTKR